ncbi:hypothetical protein SARC_15965, partial [Sphaeroforma arctica JP610]
QWISQRDSEESSPLSAGYQKFWFDEAHNFTNVFVRSTTVPGAVLMGIALPGDYPLNAQEVNALTFVPDVTPEGMLK